MNSNTGNDCSAVLYITIATQLTPIKLTTRNRKRIIENHFKTVALVILVKLAIMVIHVRSLIVSFTRIIHSL